MSRLRILVGCAATVVAVVGLSLPALAGDSGTDVLKASDLPGDYVQAAAPETESTGNGIVVDREACSQDIAPISGLTELVTVQFAAANTGTTAMSEAITTFPKAKAANASFKKRSKDVAAAIKCNDVDVVRNGATVATLVYEKVKFPKFGDRSTAWHVRPADDTTAEGSTTTIAFLSGTHVVFLNTFGNEGSPTLKQLKTIARRAERRLQD